MSVSVEQYVAAMAAAEQTAARAATTKNAQASHFGTAAGLLSCHIDKQAEAVKVFERAPSYRGESLRRFMDGVEAGRLVYATLADFVNGDTADAWAEQEPSSA
jgi:hypothetical protein